MPDRKCRLPAAAVLHVRQRSIAREQAFVLSLGALVVSSLLSRCFYVCYCRDLDDVAVTTFMKTKRVFLMMSIFSLGMLVGYLVGVRSVSPLAITNLKQIGLAFRYGVNDVAQPYPPHRL